MKKFPLIFFIVLTAVEIYAQSFNSSTFYHLGTYGRGIYILDDVTPIREVLYTGAE